MRDTFYAQHQLESLDVESTILDELKHTGTAKTEMELRSILGCFLFSGEEAFKKIKVLSGGEKSRVALAKVLISEANFLLLDEPTNHLDMLSVNILIQALQQYEGTYVVVSHDRYFVSEIANKIWYIEDEEIKVYPGTFDEYETFMEGRSMDDKKPNASIKKEVKENKTELKTAPKPKAVNQNELIKLENEIAKLEEEITNIEKQKVELETKLADPKIFADRQAFSDLNNNYMAIEKSLKIANLNWEQKMELLEKQIG